MSCMYTAIVLLILSDASHPGGQEPPACIRMYDTQISCSRRLTQVDCKLQTTAVELILTSLIGLTADVLAKFGDKQQNDKNGASLSYIRVL